MSLLTDIAFAIKSKLDLKVNVIAGKQLSTEDYTTLEKAKLAGITGSGTQTSITGNAGTATALQTARTINGVAFDGTGNITVQAVDATARIASSLIGVANGVVPLDATTKIAAAYLPSYVDDVVEGANLAAFPAIGETGKIYIALDTNKSYRFGGSVYVAIASGNVDSVAGKTGVITLTKTDVGLANVDNTSDALKPLSNASSDALALKADKSTTYTQVEIGTTAAFITALG